MGTVIRNTTQLSLRLPAELKSVIEDAAAVTGQSVSEFGISTLLQESQNVLQQSQTTQLSNRDRDKFVAMLDGVESKPNRALVKATREYRKRVG